MGYAYKIICHEIFKDTCKTCPARIHTKKIIHINIYKDYITQARMPSNNVILNLNRINNLF